MRWVAGILGPTNRSAGISPDVNDPGARNVTWDELVTAYKEAYEKATGKPVSTFGGYAHDALRILVDALTRAGSAEPSDIRDAIEGTKGLVGTTGTVTMTAEDHLGLDLSAFRMLQIENGGWKIVE